MKRTNGYSLLETSIAAAVFFLLILCAVRLMVFTSQASGRALAQHELRENARTALEVLTANVELAEKVSLKTSRDGSLRSLIVWEEVLEKEKSVLKPYEFRYNSQLNANEASYHRLLFGGANELASYIRWIKMSIQNGVLRIVLSTDDHVKGRTAINALPITLQTAISLRGKEVIYLIE
ncbi:MAG: hypothetical protein LBT44_10120 [Clostridiales bacterium]|jgi:type II secretory pathway component PulJ|nr:hypothetical protein [Clostridiales bacterium]